MKHQELIALLVLGFTVWLNCMPNGAHACTVCHSKDPKMVSMHEALEFKDCFICHGPRSKRTGDRKNEMTTAELCVRCHAAGSTSSTLPAPVTK